MFDDTQPQTPGRPVSGPPPGRPIQPFGPPSYGASPSPMSVSPESMRSVPSPVVPPMVPPKRPTKSGGRGRRILLILIIVLVLLGGGVAVAALMFPNFIGLGNANTIANVISNLNANSNGNTNRASNLNRTNTNRSNVNSANLNAANTNFSSNTNGTANLNAANVNATVNANTNVANVNASNLNTNAVTNTNTPPATYTIDTDGDKLNDYLEEWVGTSKTNADSDGDGFPDGNEVMNKYSPLGDGAMTAAGFQTFCAQSTVVTQYALPSTDVSTLCGIGSNMISNIQVMATNSQFFDDLLSELTTSCTSFGKIDKTVCTGLISFLIVNYLVSG